MRYPIIPDYTSIRYYPCGILGCERSRARQHGTWSKIPAVKEEKGNKYKGVINVAILESIDERVKLLKSGFTGKDIETLYVILNSLDFVGVNWQKISDYHDDFPVFDRHTSEA